MISAFGHVRDNFRVWLLIVLSYVKDDLETFMVYLLLAQKTPAHCDYSGLVGDLGLLTAATQVVCVPLCSYLTDATSRHSRSILVASLFLELGLEGWMIFWSNYSWPALIAMQLARQVAHTQNYNGIWKLFKTRVYLRLGDSRYKESEEVFMSVGMLGIGAETFLDVLIFLPLFLAVHYGHASFDELTWVVFAAELLLTALSIAAACSVTDYYLQGGAAAAALVPESTRSLLADHGDADSPPVSGGHFLSSTGQSYHSFGEGSPDEAGGILSYMRLGFRSIMRKQAAVPGLLFHALLVYLFWQLAYGSITLNVANETTAAAGGHGAAPRTTDNFCGGAFRVLLLQSAVSYALYVGAALFFIACMVHVPVHDYFRTVYPLASMIFVGCVVPLFWTERLPATLESVIAAALSVLPWFFYRYNTLVVSSLVEEKFLGFLLAFIGYIRYLSPVLPGLLLHYHLDHVTIVIAFALVLSSLAFSLWFGHAYRAHLLEIGSLAVAGGARSEVPAQPGAPRSSVLKSYSEPTNHTKIF